MPTRAATKKAAALLAQNSAAATLSSPPITPVSAPTEAAAGNASTQDAESGVMSDVQTPTSAPKGRATRKREPAIVKKENKFAEPVMGGWDIKPHGMGKDGDLLDDNFGNSGSTGIAEPLAKRVKRGRTVAKSPEDPVTEELLAAAKEEFDDVDAVETDVTVKSEAADLKKKRKRSPRKAKGTNTLGSAIQVAGKVDQLAETAGTVAKVKKNKYGLLPGQTPYPDHAGPSPEQCEEVNRLLTLAHGEVKPPDNIPPPSETVTGCGEVPDLLDALMRTLLSASTTANNANLSMKGLKQKFGLRTTGKGAGSVSWEAVHEASIVDVIEAIRSGGLAQVKGNYIKKILAIVYKQNENLLQKLLEEMDTDEPIKFPGKTLETKNQKQEEIKSLRENMFSMDYVHNLDSYAAMEEMTKLPGIGVKTSACVILFCMKIPCFAVDTHVVRHCKWLGWVPSKATRDKTFSHCEVRVPDHLKYSLHQLLLRHGKTCNRCKANTCVGTEKWDKTVCPIEHLVTRTEPNKQPGYKPSKKQAEDGKVKTATKEKQKVAKGSNKRKRVDDESEDIMDSEVDDELHEAEEETPELEDDDGMDFDTEIEDSFKVEDE